MKLIAILIIALLIGGAYGQDFVKASTIQLSGVNASVFEGSYFKQPGWVFDSTAYGRTASQTAFLKDGDEGKIPDGYQPRKAAFLGTPVHVADPRVM